MSNFYPTPTLCSAAYAELYIVCCYPEAPVPELPPAPLGLLFLRCLLLFYVRCLVRCFCLSAWFRREPRGPRVVVGTLGTLLVEFLLSKVLGPF